MTLDDFDFGYVAYGRRRMSDRGVRCHAIRKDTFVALCGFDGAPSGFDCDTDAENLSCKRCKASARKLGILPVKENQ